MLGISIAEILVTVLIGLIVANKNDARYVINCIKTIKLHIKNMQNNILHFINEEGDNHIVGDDGNKYKIVSKETLDSIRKNNKKL